MKKILLAITLVLAAAIHTTVLASVNYDSSPIVKIKCGEQKSSLNLFLSNLLKETTYLEMIDSRGNTIYKETITDHKSYSRKLNLSDVLDGNYMVYIENDRIEVTQPILIEKGIVKVLEEEKIEILAPSIEAGDKFVKFQLAPNSKSKKVTITILQGEETIYESKEVFTSSIIKQYKLDNLYRGDYTFRATVDGKNYYESIEIK